MDASKYNKIVRHGISFYTNNNAGDGVLKAVLAQCPPDNVVIAITREYIAKTGQIKKYCEYASVTREQLRKLLLSDNAIYEVMHEHRKQHVAFDIDLKGMGISNPLKEVKQKIFSILPNARLHISGGHWVAADENRDVYSYHLIVANYYATSTHALAPIKGFCTENKHLGFDPALYKENGLIKCINQSKGDGRVQGRISGSSDIMNHTVMHNFPKGAVDIETLDLTRFLPAHVPAGGKRKRDALQIQDVLDFPKMNLTPPRDFDLYEAGPLELLDALPNHPRYHEWQLSHSVCKSVQRWCKAVGLPWETFWNWNKSKDDSAARFEKYLRYWSQIDLKKFPCRTSLLKTYLIGYVYNGEILKSEPTRKMEEGYNTFFDHRADGRYLSAKDHLLAQNEKFVCAHAGLGSAKSQSTMQWLAGLIEKNPRTSILWLTCRIALTNDQRGRIEEMTGCRLWKYYLDLKPLEKHDQNRSPEQYFVCSINSIHCVRRKYDVVVIDECETLLSSFGGDAKTHRKVMLHWNIFLDCLRDAKKIAFLDGFVTNITKDFIRDVGGKPFIIGTGVKPRPRKMVLCDSVEYIYAEIEKSLSRGEKIFVATGPKGKGNVDAMGSVENIVSYVLVNHRDWSKRKRTEQWEKGYQVIGYHGDAEKEKKRLAKDVNALWCDPAVRMVVGNSALAVGVNCDPDPADLDSGKLEQFDRVFGIFNPSCQSMRDFFQLLFRVRHPKDDTFIVHLGSRCSPGREPRPPELPKDVTFVNLQRNLKTEQRANNCATFKRVFRLFCGWMNIDLNTEDLLKLSEKEADEVRSHLDSSFNMFSWKNIRDMDAAEFALCIEELDEGSASASVDLLLRMEKYRFASLLVGTLPEEEKAELWNAHRHFTQALHVLGQIKHGVDYQKKRPAAHIIWNFYRDNNLELTDKIPETAICNTALKDIQRAFTMHNEPQTMRMDLFQKMLEIYFRSSILWKNREKGSKNRKYTWETETSLIASIMPKLVVWNCTQFRLERDEDDEGA